MLTLFTYKKCTTCQKATHFLNDQSIAFTEHPIRETPPSKNQLKAMLNYYKGDIKKLFNTSGQDYRAMNMKSKLPELNEEAALNLLNQNGNLVKRPFLLDKTAGLVGFKEDEWRLFCERTV